MAGKQTSSEESDSKGLYQSWMQRISDALKREKDYRLEAQKVVDLYEAKDAENNPFAILYSNTETLSSAIYSNLPVPVVMRRFRDEDPLGKAASEVATRVLKFYMDDENANYDNADELFSAAVIDTLITNRGVTRFKFYAKPTEDGSYTNECVYGEAVRWDKFFHGYARTWKKVPWIGFEWDMTEAEMKKNYPEVKGIDFKNIPEGIDAGDDPLRTESRQELTGVRLAKVYEVWDKDTRTVLHLSPAAPDVILKKISDPYNLVSFFPVPKPMNLLRKITTLLPTPLYIYYRSQARELNEITNRLKALIKAAKIRGFYNSMVEGIDKVLQADDNELIPLENSAALSDNQSVDRLIFLMPLQEIVGSIQVLYQQRDQVKSVIYEITGISDILRGASRASETATAQNIKSQWGSIRLRKFQKEVQRYVRDCLRIMLEIGVSRTEIKTIELMTGLKYPTDEQKQQVIHQIEQQAMQAQMQAQMSGQPLPPPPQPDPKTVQMLQAPSWEQIVQVLQSDTLRAYKIDIETNSTIDIEASQDKQDIGELMNAVAQFLNGVGPLIQEGALPMDVAKTMLLAVTRRFNFGSELEDALNAMSAPQPNQQQQQAEAQAHQMEMAQKQAEGQAATAKAQAEQQKIQMQMQQDAQKHQFAMDEIQMEADLKKQELATRQSQLILDKIGLDNKAQFEERRHTQKMEQLRQAALNKEST